MNIKKITAISIFTLGIIFALLYSGCKSEGITKEERLDLFIADMESSATANPIEHFAGNAKASLIIPDTFNNTNMAPDDALDIISYSIVGDTFTMDFDAATTGSGQNANGAFTSVPSDMNGEDWYIYWITVPLVTGGLRTIPDDL